MIKKEFESSEEMRNYLINVIGIMCSLIVKKKRKNTLNVMPHLTPK